MKALVTGGSGFIGSRLVEALRDKGHGVVILDLVVNPRFRDITVQGDVADPAAVARAMDGVDVVFNLAAQHRDDVRPISRYYDTNVTGMRVVCDEMERRGIGRMVFTSSVAVYGFDTDDCREDEEKRPDNDYGKSKWEAEGVLREWLAGGVGRLALVIRPCVVFGPANRGNVYNLLVQVLSGKFLMIGSGRNRKSIAYVDNVVDAIMFVSQLGESAVVNYADKPDMDMNTLVATIADAGRRSVPRLRLPRAAGMVAGAMLDAAARLTGRSFPLSRVRVHKFCANSVVNADRIRGLGFVPRVTLEAGLRQTVRSEFGT